MKRTLVLPVILALAAFIWLLRKGGVDPPDERVTPVEASVLRLGKAGAREWDDGDPRPIHGERYEKAFTAATNQGSFSLLMGQGGVKRSWAVWMNDQKLGNLRADENALECLLEIPPGVLRDGVNTLRIEPPELSDDITLGPITLIEATPEVWLAGGEVSVLVTDAADGQPLPCRLTVTRADGVLAALSAGPEDEVAVRPGVVYTRRGRATLSLPVGDYEICVGRGFEWGLATATVRVKAGRKSEIALSLHREVDTRGWIAVDSHIHTLALSRHGDATLRERVLTIAGEGIELAIATEHNHHGDYGPSAAASGIADRFTTVVGNEVTTKHGHFNAFPVGAGAPVVDSSETDWGKLLPAIRATPEVRVVTLNHPRDAHSGFVPLGEAEFDASTGIHRREADFDIDAMEVITSGAMQSDLGLLYRDWFALLNRGHRLAAIASSDSHDVTRFILGQGRTYAAARDDEPGRLDLDEVWESYAKGRLLVSLGLLAQIEVDGRFSVGDLATGLGDAIRVETVVSGPSWARADQMALYANGQILREARIDDPGKPGEKARIAWEIARPEQDAHLVAVATGPGVTEAFWPIPRPYQPSDPVFVSRVIASTNPVWIDGNGDGRYEVAGGLPTRGPR